jgi:hypothetical protein
MKKSKVTEPKQLVLHVPPDFKPNPWFESARPEEVAIVLDLASRIPCMIEKEGDQLHAKLHAARDDATACAMQKMLKEMSAHANDTLKMELENTQRSYNELQQQKDELLAEKTKMTAEYQTLVKQHELNIMSKDHVLELERTKLEEEKRRLSETNDLKIDAERHKLITQHTEQYKTLLDEHTNLKNEYELHKQNVDAIVESKRQEEIDKMSNHMKTLTEQHTNAYEKLRSSKIDLDTKVVALATEKCELAQKLSEVTTNAALEAAKMSAQISELQTPMGRGGSGEYDVATCLTELGFVVEDTSTGDKKNQGYLDLLVHHANSKIAFEIKNKKTIRKASQDKVDRHEKDIDDDVKTFQQRVRDGVKNGLFDAAVFVSIRSHTKMGDPVVLEMVSDSTDRPLVPVSYIGPEKGKSASPLTQEQLETHTYLMFGILEQCDVIRKELCNGIKDQDIDSLQRLFEDMGTFLNKTFVDLRKQERLIDDMAKNLTEIRVRCIQMFRSVYGVNNRTPWLQKNMMTNWMPILETSQERAATMNDAEIWNKIGKQKQTIENSIGKDAMFQVIRMQQDASPSSPQTEDMGNKKRKM